MVKKTLYIICFLWFSTNSILHAQQTAELIIDTVPKIVLKKWIKKDGICLRWVVNNKIAWKYSNEHGFILERVTVKRDNKFLAKPERKILTGKAIKPKHVTKWEPLIQKNDIAAVVAQALYGEDFEVNNNDEKSVVEIFYQSEELDRRFAFAMFAIDQDFEISKLAGYGYEDNTTKSNEEYLYNIKSAVPEELMLIKKTGVLAKAFEVGVLPKPYDFSGYFYENSFVLIWEYDSLTDYFNSYDIEKSEDGLNFSKINKVPISKIQESTVSGISYTDSITEYGKRYWYRIRGRSLFNSLSEPSDTVGLIGFKELTSSPTWKTSKINSSKEVELSWTFPKEELWKVKAFDLMIADKAIGPYKDVEKEIPTAQNNYTYSKLKDINYFKIRVNGIAGDVKLSSPTMVQPIDSIPPVKPEGLKGIIDTLGIVRLSWDANTELDLRGYALFRANRPNQEFTRFHKEELFGLNYADTINLKTFNKKVYYKLSALDQRYNESLRSDILELSRPDKIPPVSPVFKSYEVLSEGVHLRWHTSSSDDVIKQIIYRKSVTDLNWENIFETEDIVLMAFIDKNTINDTKYLYTIITIDATGLESKPSPPISITTPKTLVIDILKSLFAKVDRENKFIQLNWRLNNTAGIEEIQLFKKESSSQFALYKTFNSDIKQFIDSNLKLNSKYTYGIRATLKDGTVSNWVEKEITY